MSRRTVWTVVIGMLAGVILFTPLVSWGQAKGPIKIGYISPLSGGMAANGKDMLAGIELYLQEIGSPNLTQLLARFIA